MGRPVLVSTHDDRLTRIADRVIGRVPHYTGADREPEKVRPPQGESSFITVTEAM